jgi:transcriptional regulator with XRE-family HTH domain
MGEGPRGELAEKIAGEVALSDDPGATIRKWRTDFDVTQTELAETLDISSSVISDYESGRRDSPGIAVVRRLVEGLLDIDERRGGDRIRQYGRVLSAGFESDVVLDLREYPAAIPVDDVFDVDCDVLAPCALGGALNDDTIPRLECDIVCGAANNQLEDEDRHGQMLHDEGIIYAPDYLANSGRTIDDTDLLRKGGYNHTRSRAMIDEIYDRMVDIGEQAEHEDRPTYAIANEVARERIENVDSARKKVTERRKPQW